MKMNLLERKSIRYLTGKVPPKLRIMVTSLRGNLTYNQDGLACTHNCDFINNQKFKRAYEAGKKINSWGEEVHWRAYILCWAANQVKHLEGDFVECGVYKGKSATTVMEYINFKDLNKKFYLIDTYGGFDKETLSTTERDMEKYYNYDDFYEEVVNNFKGREYAKIIKGSVPKVLSLIKTNKICFLAIDMNCAEPEIAAATFFWDKLVSGGMIILDDYGWTKHIEQKRAFDKFATERGIEVLSLPTGQGMIIKK